MRKLRLVVLGLSLLIVKIAVAQMPPGFSWVNIESDKTTMATVRRALHDPTITSIREVGMKGGFALVMTASRESDAPTPDYDRWTIYNVTLRTGSSQVLTSGYGVKLLDWIGSTKSELAITYYDCWECEAATLFTTFRFKDNIGWQARWPNKTQDAKFPQPGAVVKMTDVGDPYDDDVVDQVFAVITQPNNHFAVGSWTHSRNAKNGKVDDSVERYSIDPATQEDRIEELSGQAALIWERQICDPSHLLIQPSNGQDSKTCRNILRVPTSQRGHSQ
jgi:hypothetical protein